MAETNCPPSIRGRHRQLDDSLVGQIITTFVTNSFLSLVWRDTRAPNVLNKMRAFLAAHETIIPATPNFLGISIYYRIC